jgi:hypothetical protein
LKRLLTICFFASLLPWIFQGQQLISAGAAALKGFGAIQVTEHRLRFSPRVAYVEAIERGRYAEANHIAQLAQTYGHELDPTQLARIDRTTMQRAGDVAADLAMGAMLGRAESGSQIAGMVAADLFVLGDIRDLAIEFESWRSGNGANQLIVGLSAVGIATSAGTLVAGSTGAVDIGLSITKAAVRTGRMSEKLVDHVTMLVRRSVDMDALAGLAHRSSAELSDDSATFALRLRSVVRTEHAVELREFAGTVGDIARAGGSRSALVSLELADDGNQLRRLGDIARHFGDRAATAMKLVGKGIFAIFDIIWSAILGLLPVIFAIGRSVLSIVFRS